METQNLSQIEPNNQVPLMNVPSPSSKIGGSKKKWLKIINWSVVIIIALPFVVAFLYGFIGAIINDVFELKGNIATSSETCRSIVSAPIFGFSNPINKSKSNNYYVHEGCVFYSPMGNTFELGANKITDADIKTFRVLDSDYAMDKNNIYVENNIINGIKPEILDSLDQKTLSFVPDHYGFPPKPIIKDKDNVYLAGVKVDGADPASFEKMHFDVYHPNETYYWDKNNIYAYAPSTVGVGKVVRLDGVDKTTFLNFKNGVAADKNHAYFLGTIVPDSNSSSVEHFGGSYYRFGQKIFYCDWDSGTMIFVSDDIAHFQTTENDGYKNASDSRNTYYKGIVVNKK